MPGRFTPLSGGHAALRSAQRYFHSLVYEFDDPNMQNLARGLSDLTNGLNTLVTLIYQEIEALKLQQHPGRIGEGRSHIPHGRYHW